MALFNLERKKERETIKNHKMDKKEKVVAALDICLDKENAPDDLHDGDSAICYKQIACSIYTI